MVGYAMVGKTVMGNSVMCDSMMSNMSNMVGIMASSWSKAAMESTLISIVVIVDDMAIWSNIAV